MRNSPLRAFASPIKEEEKQRTSPAKPLPKEKFTQELLNINIKEASKKQTKKTKKQKRKDDWDLN